MQEPAPRPAMPNVIQFINSREVAKRVDYALSQLKTLAELGIVQGLGQELINSLAKIFEQISNGKTEEEVMGSIDSLTSFLTKFGEAFTGKNVEQILEEIKEQKNEFLRLKEQTAEQDDQIASLMQQVQESYEGASSRTICPCVSFQEVQDAISAHDAVIEKLFYQSQDFSDEAAALEEVIRPLQQQLEFADGEERTALLKECRPLQKRLQTVEKLINRTAELRELHNRELAELERYSMAWETLLKPLPETLISIEVESISLQREDDRHDTQIEGTDNDKEQETERERSHQNPAHEFVALTPLSQITNSPCPRRVQLERLAKTLDMPSETIFMLSLYDIIPPGLRQSRMRGNKTLLKRAFETGILEKFRFSSPDEILNRWRGNEVTVDFIRSFLSKGCLYKGTFIHARNEVSLPWSSQELFTEEEIKEFLILDQKDRERNRAKEKDKA